MEGEETGLALQKGGEAKKKKGGVCAWRKGKVQSLGFLAALPPCTSRPRCLPVLLPRAVPPSPGRKGRSGGEP